MSCNSKECKDVQAYIDLVKPPGFRGIANAVEFGDRQDIQVGISAEGSKEDVFWLDGVLMNGFTEQHRRQIDDAFARQLAWRKDQGQSDGDR